MTEDRKEYMRKYMKEWRTKEPERHYEYRKRYAQSENGKKVAKLWRERNKEHLFYLRKRFKVLMRDGFKCAYCGRTANETQLQVDHIIPKSKGGTNEMENLITSCFDCNQGKSDTLLT